MLRRLLFITILLFVMVATALAQDNPLPMGAPSGGNHRPHVYNVPYIFGNGCNIVVKWKKQLDVAPYATRRNMWHNMTFDEDGFLYFRAAFGNVEAGIYKVDPANGQKLWWGAAVPDTVFSTQSAIIGRDYVYAARYDGANPTVYALNKANGLVVWESRPLPMPVALNMALYDGVLYGTTTRDGQGNNHAFAIDASNGNILHATPYATSGDNVYYNIAFAPNVFGQNEHGMYWLHNDNGDLGEAIYGIGITAGGAWKAWSSTPIRAYSSNVIYNPDMNAVYALHWQDYGTSVESYDPVTGAIRWTAKGDGDPSLGFPGSFNDGYYTTHTLKPDGTGFIFSCAGGADTWSVTDPGDIGGAALNYNAHGDWFYDGPAELNDTQTCAVTVVDPVSGREVFMTGTSSNGQVGWERRLMALDVQTGALLWEWINPGDVAPLNAGGNFRALSVGPDGTLYYQDAQEGPHGTLYAITSAGIPGDVDGNGVVDGLDLTAVITAWQTVPGDPLWNPCADLDANLVVDGLDLTEVIANWTISSSSAPEKSEPAKPGKRLGNVRKGR